MEHERYLTEKDLLLFGEVFASFHRIINLDEMLAVIFSKIKPIIKIEGASIALHDASTREFYFYRTIEDNEVSQITRSASVPIPRSSGYRRLGKRTRETVLINDVARDDRVLNINLRLRLRHQLDDLRTAEIEKRVSGCFLRSEQKNRRLLRKRIKTS